MDDRFLSVIMPVYNEKDTIEKIVSEVLKLDILKELIIVDDGSIDGTRNMLEKIGAKEENIRLFFHDNNQGKGGCIRTGLAAAEGDVMVFQDADLEYDPNEINELVGPIKKGVADVVYGSRLWGGKPQRVHMFLHLLGNRFLTLITNILFNTTLTDMETCYKVFTKKAIEGINIRSNDFTMEPEITAKFLKKKLRIYEMPISYYGRTYEEGKKITWRHGITALIALFRYRFSD